MADRPAPAAISGVFADYRLVKTRGVLQLVVEVPVERQAEVFAALGYPMPGEEKPVAVARLQSYPSGVAADAAISAAHSVGGEGAGGGIAVAPRHPQPSDPMKAVVRRAVMLCKDERFRRWVFNGGDLGENMAAEQVRAFCDVDSRAEIATNPDAHKRFLALEASYRQATGQMAEERG